MYNYKSRELIGLFLTTIFAYSVTSPHIYGYGGGDHKNQLLLVKHTINEIYLINDWYVNAGTAVNSPRFYYTHLLATHSQLLGVANTFHIFYILASLGILLGIYIFIGEIFDDELSAIIVCGIFLMGQISLPLTPPFPPFASLAGKRLINPALIPSYLALPLLLF
jgi:hypothetical protein